MRVAVTGAAGHVGANLCRALLAGGHSVKALVYQDTRALQGLDVARITGNILQPDTLPPLLDDIDVAFHLAAKVSVHGDPTGEVRHVNVVGTQNLLQACRKAGVSRLIHFSSIEALEQQPLNEPLTESRALDLQNRFAYAATKAQSEHLVRQSICDGLHAVILNPTAMIGPYDFKPSHTGKMLLDLYRGRVPAIVDGGFDFVDVRDVVAAAIAAMEQNCHGERYILSGHWIHMRQLANLWQEITGRAAPRCTTPGWLAQAALPLVGLAARLFGTTPLYSAETLSIVIESNRHISHDKARRELDYHPRPLAQTLAETHTWLQQAGMLKND